MKILRQDGTLSLLSSRLVEELFSINVDYSILEKIINSTEASVLSESSLGAILKKILDD